MAWGAIVSGAGPLGGELPLNVACFSFIMSCVLGSSGEPG
jgi:hypothetical protein